MPHAACLVLSERLLSLGGPMSVAVEFMCVRVKSSVG